LEAAGLELWGRGEVFARLQNAGGNMRQFILAAASIAALAFAGQASAADQPVVIKFSHVVAADTPKGKAADKFKELAEKYTNGKVKVEIYPNSTLYKDKEELEALQLGAVQMLAPSNSKFGPIGIKEFEVFDLPYILPDLKTLRKVTDGPLGARLLKLLDSKGMTGLAYWDNGFKQMSANKKLVAPSDYKGLKFRIQSIEGAGSPVPHARLDPAGDGVLRCLSGAADRRRRRAGEHLVEHLHPENA
jgi:C4-dicarboxylate-binding protein DctP